MLAKKIVKFIHKKIVCTSVRSPGYIILFTVLILFLYYFFHLIIRLILLPIHSSVSALCLRLEHSNDSKSSLGFDRYGARARVARVARAVLGARGRQARPRPPAAAHADEAVHVAC